MKKLFLAMAAVLAMVTLQAQAYKGSEKVLSPEEKLNEEYCTGLFKSADGTILDIATNVNTVIPYFNILDWLQGRVAGLQIYKTRTGLSIPVIRGTVAGIYVNEMPVSPSFLSSLSTYDVAMIKIIKSPFMGGFNGAGGAIAIYTLMGDDGEEEDVVKN